MVLIFLGALHPKFSKALPNVIGSSTVKSLEDTYHFLLEVVSSELQVQPVWRFKVVQLLRFKAEELKVRVMRVILEVKVVVVAV